MGKALSFEEVQERIWERHPTIKLIKTEGVGKKGRVTLQCEVCNGFFDKGRTEALSNPYSCPYCAGRRINPEFNSLWARRPDLHKYIIDEDFAKTVSAYSPQKIKTKCPICQTEKELEIKSFTKRPYSCRIYGDGVSYPNKFIRNFMKQLPVDDWTQEYKLIDSVGKKYFYDVWFKYQNKSYVIEMDGLQHFGGIPFYNSYESIKEQDNKKDELAKENNLIIIRIDARESKLDWIRSNIEDSKLSSIFDLSHIDWNLCGQQAESSNVVHQICKYVKNNPTMTLTNVAKEFKIDRHTVHNYINRGIECGILTEEENEQIKEIRAKALYEEQWRRYN